MVKKVFALASITALSGLIMSAAAAGCSSTVTVPDTGDGAVADSGNIKDSTPRDTSPEPEDAATTCPTNSPIDTSDEPFKSPAPAVVGACTDADLKAMEANVPTVTMFSDLEKNVSAACVACAFTQGSANLWGPIVLSVTVGTQTGDIFNTGACVALVSGQDACGKAYAEFDDCTSQACDSQADPSCTGTAQQNCFQTAAQGICDTQRQGVLTACGANVQTYLQQCDNAGQKGCTTCGGTGGDIQYQFEEYVVQQCVHDPKLTDAAAGDGG